MLIDNKGFSVVDVGTIQTSLDKSISVTENYVVRGRFIAASLKSIIDRFSISILCAEVPVGSKSVKAIRALSLVQGIVLTLPLIIPNGHFYFVTPTTVKKTLTGNSYAEKSEVAAAVKKKTKFSCDDYPIEAYSKLTKEGIYDSLAVTLACLNEINSSRSQKLKAKSKRA